MKRLWLAALGVFSSSALAQSQSPDQLKSQLEGASAALDRLSSSHPMQTVNDLQHLWNKAGLNGFVVTLSLLIIASGFVFSLHRAHVQENSLAMKGAFWNLIVSALVVGVAFANVGGTSHPWNFSQIFVQGWGTTYEWSKEKFAGDMDATLAASQKSMTTVIVNTTLAEGTIGIVQSVGLGLGSAVGFVKTDDAAKALTGRTGAVFGKLKNMAAGVQTLYIAYSSGVTLMALLVLCCTYAFPIAVAFTNWGASQGIYRILGTLVGCWLAILVFPGLMTVAINQALVKPASQMEAMSLELKAMVNKVSLDSAAAAREIDAAAKARLETCRSQILAKRAQTDCPTWASVASEVTTKLTAFVTNQMGPISDALKSMLETSAMSWWGQAAMAINCVIAILFLVVGFTVFSDLLGGVGADIKASLR